MLGPFATASLLTPIHQMSLAVLSRAACASMSTTTTTTRDRGDRYGPMEWAQLEKNCTRSMMKVRPTALMRYDAHTRWTPLLLLLLLASAASSLNFTDAVS